MMPEEPRHKLSDRLFHWIMAILVITLLGTAFLPILGLKFDWIPIHWISGTLLIAAVIFHLCRALFVHGLKEMLPTAADIKMSSAPEQKYDLNQKLYHWSVGTIILALLVTGGLMMAKIDTPFWKRDPSILTDWNWGIVYVVHGGASMLLIFFFILHIYFAFLPEHRTLLQSMIFGKPVGQQDNQNDK
ncbi:MAG: hypothetical protein GKS01_11220 [Alphaproteobacteria bacterium]|nr:hypothetical protein [Alphaproteobacteria bacterium]